MLTLLANLTLTFTLLGASIRGSVCEASTMYHLVFPDEPPLTKEQCCDPQAEWISEWMHELRQQKEDGGPHWPHVPIVFPPLRRAK